MVERLYRGGCMAFCAGARGVEHHLRKGQGGGSRRWCEDGGGVAKRRRVVWEARRGQGRADEGEVKLEAGTLGWRLA